MRIVLKLDHMVASIVGIHMMALRASAHRTQMWPESQLSEDDNGFRFVGKESNRQGVLNV
jgi:hypothetical protein